MKEKRGKNMKSDISNKNIEYVIETNNLTKKFGKNFKSSYAVKGVNMHIKKGAIYGLIGKNGAGKTTIMRMICGLARPTEGEIQIFGENAGENMTYRRLGTLIENPGVFPGMSAYDNMKCKAICLGISGYKEKINEILKLVGLESVGKKHAKKFSLGMKQRLGIGLALLGSPDVLILDEPINGLDPQGILEIRELLIKLNREKNITILISSHILEELSKLVTHYGIVKDGELIEEISSEKLREKCLERIEVKTDNPDKASTVIEKMGISNYKVVDKNTIHIYEKLNELKEINKILIKNDIDVDSISLNSEGLEDYFIDITGR